MSSPSIAPRKAALAGAIPLNARLRILVVLRESRSD
jgi:hypothetical protein